MEMHFITNPLTFMFSVVFLLCILIDCDAMKLLIFSNLMAILI